MAEQDRRYSCVAEFSTENAQRTVAGEEDDVDGEIDEMDEGEKIDFAAKNTNISGSPFTKRDTNVKNNKYFRKQTVSDRRRHRRHHRSSHRRQRRRTTDANDFNSELGNIFEKVSSDEDWRLAERPISKCHVETIDDSIALACLSSHREHGNDSGNDLHVYQSRSMKIPEGFSDGNEPLECEDPFKQRYTNYSKQIIKVKQNQDRLPVPSEEDGEILEDGELEEAVGGNDGEDVDKDSTEVLPFMLSCNVDTKRLKHYRKKSYHKNRRKRRSDNKVKGNKCKHAAKLENESNSSPAWGSGYYGPKPKHSHHGRDCHSPPGLYDSLSHSEASEEETASRMIMSEGYINPSDVAGEKEGICYPRVSLGKMKKLSLIKNDRKRGRNLEGKYDDPPRKRPKVDAVINDRRGCTFYLEGKRIKDSVCQFNHDTERAQKMEICKYHLTVKGCIKQRCIYMHDFPCKYYHTGAICYSGDRCKFSHDPLTEETRKALEMRVAAEDIIDMEKPDYEFESRPRESQSRLSLLGSPPRHQEDVKKIPSLFEIEVHIPGKSPKPSQEAVRSSGFYGVSTNSPKTGVGIPGSSPNKGMINNLTTMNQHCISKQTNMGGPGLLQTSLRPGNIMVGPMDRPTMVMNIQHGLNTQLQRPCGGASIQFLGLGKINNNQHEGSLPPVLNMLGAMICEAALQQGPRTSNSNMNVGSNCGLGSSDILQSMRNLGSGVTIVSPSNMQQANLGMVSNGMVQSGISNIVLPKNMQPNGTNNIQPLHNMMALHNIMRNIGANIRLGPHDNLGPGCTVSNDMVIKNHMGAGQEVGNIDVDYRIKPAFEVEKTNTDISELDKIRQQIQAQIDKEDEEEEQEETDGTIKDGDKNCYQLSPGQIDSIHDNEDFKDDKTVMKKKVVAEVEDLQIPADLPKKQRELFKRIQQQHLLREKERKRRNAIQVTEKIHTKNDDDCYSSDEDVLSDNKTKLAEVLNQKPISESSVMLPCTSSIYSSNDSESPPSSTLNIIQMINAIKSQTTSKPIAESVETSSSKSISTMNFPQPPKSILTFPASAPPPVSTTLKSMSSIYNLHISKLTVEPSTVNAHPVHPLVYSVVQILLDMPKPYSQLPNHVNASDSAFKDDPRIKWHLQHLEKQIQKAWHRRDSSDGERHLKKTDPRLKKQISDPCFVTASESPKSISSDTRQQRIQTQSRPADPRITRQVGGNLDPRLGRQNSQNIPESPFLSDQMNSKRNLSINNMGEVMSKQLGGVVSQLGVSNQFSNSQSSNGLGDLVNYAGSMRGSMNSQLSGPGRQLQGGGGLVGNNRRLLSSPVKNIFGHINQVVGPFNQMGTGTNQIIRMGGLQGPGSFVICQRNVHMIGGYVGNIIRRPTNQHSPARKDTIMSEPWINASSVPRTGAQRVHHNPLAAIDPRLRNRQMGLQEQRMFTKEIHPGNVSIQDDDLLKDFRHSDDGWDNYRQLQSNLRAPNDFREKPSCNQDNALLLNNSDQFNISLLRDDHAPQSDNRTESNDSTQPSKLSLSAHQYSDTDNKPTHKFDYKNYQRFKRVKKLTEATESTMEYSCPILSGEDFQRDFANGQGTRHNDYIQHGISGQGSDNRNVHSPSLPDTLHDFDFPNSSALTVQECSVDLKVKDLFKTIDPTASPFC